MSITDELREYAKGSGGVMYSAYQAVLAIADRIDAEHERGMADAKDETMDAIRRDVDSYWIRLPKDADGEVIRVGDVMECWDDRPIESFEVRSLVFDGETWSVCDRLGPQVIPRYLRHHHEPTVEDVLEEFYRTAKADSDANMGDLYETIADYAKRLRLAGEGE